MKNSRGLTLVEVLVVIGSLSLISFIMMSEVVRWSQMTGRYDNRDRMLEAFLENVAEIKSTGVDDLPAMGKCFLRRYSLMGEYQGESEWARPTGGCERPSEDGILIVWDLPTQAEFSVTYDSDLLKLPVYREALKEVIVTGYINDPGHTGGSVRPFTVTLYRR